MFQFVEFCTKSSVNNEDELRVKVSKETVVLRQWG